MTITPIAEPAAPSAPPPNSVEPLVSAAELLAMDELGAAELIDGRIVEMAPTGEEHGAIEFELGRRLANFVRERDLGRVLGGEAGIFIRRDPDRVRAADIAFISKARASERPSRAYLEQAPELVVEILSPSDSWEGVRRKLEDYFSIAVERVWVVEPENRAVLVYRSPTEFNLLRAGDLLRGEGALEGFELPVEAVFEV